MTAAEPEAVGLVEVLAAHGHVSLRLAGLTMACKCGEPCTSTAPGTWHRAHIAAAIKGSAWLRAQRAEALEQAADDVLRVVHERAQSALWATQEVRDRTAAHVVLNEVADWLRRRAASAATRTRTALTEEATQ